MFLQAALQTVSRAWTAKRVHGASHTCTSSMGGATISVQKTMSPMTNSWSARHKVSPCLQILQVRRCLSLWRVEELATCGIEWLQVANKLEPISNSISLSLIFLNFSSVSALRGGWVEWVEPLLPVRENLWLQARPRDPHTTGPPVPVALR